MKKFPTPNANDKLLYVRFSAFGDVLQAVAEAKQIRDKFPKIKLSFLTAPQYAKLISAQPYIEEVICGEKRPFSVMLQTAKLLREKKFDWICCSMRGGHMPVLSCLGNVKYRLSDTEYFPFLDSCNIHKWAIAQSIDLYARNGRCIFPSDESIAFAKEILKPLHGKNTLFAVLGGSNEGKMWPIEYWTDFLKQVIAQNWGVVLIGAGKEELKIAKEIEFNLQNEAILNIVDKLSIENLSGVANECQFAIGNDTGPLHLAVLSGLKTIGIFGHTITRDVGYNMSWLSPIWGQQNFSAEQLKTLCEKDIMASIKPDQVLAIFDKLTCKGDL